MDLNEIGIFVQVVQSGSFSAAARQLSMPKSTVSRKVAQLEERIGARLIQRTTRKLGLTDAGRVYYERTARIVAEIDEAEHAVGRMQEAPRGLLRVTAPLSFSMFGPIVTEYLEQNGDVQVEMLCTDRQVDLVEERFDVAIRAGQLADSSLVARKLGMVRWVLVAAPGYCKQHGTPKAPLDLRQHSCIAFGAVAAPNSWTLESGGKQVEVRITPRLTVNDLEIMLDAARRGVGVARLPEFACRDDIRKGRLRHVLCDWSSEEAPLHAVYPTAQYLSPKVVAFIELVGKRLRLKG
jgi:DNA-binding transcriptional LysR family regulator